MKILKKIKAFFTKNNEAVEMDLTAAEIREGRAYLHIKGDSITYLVKSNDIKIFLNGQGTLSEADVFKIENKDLSVSPKQEDQNRENGRIAVHKRRELVETDPFKKRTISFSLYPQEYENLMLSMQEYGYKKTEYLLACVATATRGTMERAHKRIVKNHKEILQARRVYQESVTREKKEVKTKSDA